MRVSTARGSGPTVGAVLSLDLLLSSERELALGDGRTYRARCAPEALFIVPGMTLDLDRCAEAMDDSPGWDEVEMTDARLVPVGTSAAAVVYRFTGRRGETVYRASMSSVYAVGEDGPRLVLHQQTPLG